MCFLKKCAIMCIYVFLCAFMCISIHQNRGVQKGRRKCSAMYINVHFCTFLCISRPRHHFSCFIWSSQYSPIFFPIALPVLFYFILGIIISTSLPFIRALRNGPCHISAHSHSARASNHRQACAAASCRQVDQHLITPGLRAVRAE